MSSNTAASGHQQRHGSSLPVPGCVLLNSNASIASPPRRNATTAKASTSTNLPIEASLELACPPRLSTLAVHCPGAAAQPKILFSAEDVLLLRVAVSSQRTAALANSDYFIYRAGGGGADDPPSLTLIPHPRPDCFGDGDVGVLPRGGGLYTIASLLITGADEFELRLFDSEVGSWVTKTVTLAAPWSPFPSGFKTRRHDCQHHATSMVVTVGGEAGTMGWVDLWGGILFYDLLRDDQDNPALWHLPLPLPSDMLAINDPKGVKLNCPDSRRRVFFLIKNGKACLKLADLQSTSERLPYTDIETGWPAFAIHNWAITVWSNTEISGSYEDWHEEFTVRASGIKISNEVRLQLQKSGLLHRKPSREEEREAVEVALQNLVVSEPNVSLNGEEEDVVYVVATTKFRDRKGWVLGVDMRNSTLLGVAEFGAKYMSGGFNYRPGTISKYMNPSTTLQVTRDLSMSMTQEGYVNVGMSS
ncbi:unnamed protein product [Urochloa humidicola]